jgi:hypothetical protein
MRRVKVYGFNLQDETVGEAARNKQQTAAREICTPSSVIASTACVVTSV